VKVHAFKSGAAAAGVIGTAVPVGRCPACFAAATGVAGSLGLGSIAASPWLNVLIAAFVALGLWGLAASARSHRRWSAVSLAAAGAAALMAGRLALLGWLAQTGGALLAAAFVLDLCWKRKAARRSFVRLDALGKGNRPDVQQA